MKVARSSNINPAHPMFEMKISERTTVRQKQILAAGFNITFQREPLRKKGLGEKKNQLPGIMK